MANQIQELVSLDSKSHIYSDIYGNRYDSVSHVLHSFERPFQADLIAGLVAKRDSRPKDEVLAEWSQNQTKAAVHGTRIHSAVELFEQNQTIRPEDEDLRPMLENLSVDHQGYHRILSEVILYDPDYKIAGTTDRLLYLTKSPKSVIDIEDFKTNLSRGIQYSNPRREYLLGPLAHLQNCNFNIYALQLSAYAYMLNKMTDRKIGRLTLVYLTDQSFQKIPVPYMRYEIEKVFDAYRNPPKEWLVDADKEWGSH